LGRSSECCGQVAACARSDVAGATESNAKATTAQDDTTATRERDEQTDIPTSE
jgi:hypothetical protein